jgi:hypothetical protein
LDQIGKAGVAGQRSMLTRMAGQQRGRPNPKIKSGGKILGFSADQSNQSFSGLRGDRRLFAGAWTVVQRRQSAAGGGRSTQRCAV